MKLIPNIVITGQKYKGKATMHVAAYSYNELGAVIMKSLGYVNPTTWLQNVNMRYSIRGQLLNINNSKLAYDGGKTSNDHNDLFGMQLLYDGTDSHLDNGAGNVNKFDGRLTAVKWMSTDASGAKSYERSYVYAYDNVARYTAESYSERTVADTGAFNNNLNGFDESGISYDENGNILSLQRNSSTQGTNSHIQIDNLTYGYLLSNYNRVNTITDGTGTNYTGAGFRNLTGLSTAYAYDANGNLTNDYYKGLQNSYNVLNRVDNTTITTGTNQYINYIYDAGGSLIRKLAYNNGALTTTDYVGGFVYINGTLSYFPMPEGRVLVSGSTYTQEYIITDQQGNARISFKNNGSNAAVVTQENSYYGFGLQLLNSPVSPPAVPNKQLYNGGSEWQNDYANGSTNLPDYYQTFNRNYDAAIGRFISQDPTPESAADMSVYQYAGNMPVMLNDPMGNMLSRPGMYNAGAPSNADDDMGAWWSEVGQSMASDYTDYVSNLPGGFNYVGHYIDPEGQPTLENGKNTDTQVSVDQANQTVNDALYYTGLGWVGNSSAQNSSSAVASAVVGSDDLANISSVSNMSGVSGPNSSAYADPVVGPYNNFTVSISNVRFGLEPEQEDHLGFFNPGGYSMKAEISMQENPVFNSSTYQPTGWNTWSLTFRMTASNSSTDGDLQTIARGELYVNGILRQTVWATQTENLLTRSGWYYVGTGTFHLPDTNIGNVTLKIIGSFIINQGVGSWIPTFLFTPWIQISNENQFLQGGSILEKP